MLRSGLLVYKYLETPSSVKRVVDRYFLRGEKGQMIGFTPF